MLCYFEYFNKEVLVLDDTQRIEIINKYGVSTYHCVPGIILTLGKGARVWDTKGRQYIDMLASYSAENAGHCHPEIVAAMCQQAHRLGPVSNNFYHDQEAIFFREAAQTMGVDKKFLLMNTGAEAWERAALKIARKWAYKVRGIPKYKAVVLVAHGNFHGRTIGAISASDELFYKDAFGPHLKGLDLIPFGDVKSLERKLRSNKNIAAVVLEPIQMEGGVIIPPAGYLKDVKELCGQYNILCVHDEIQTGLGRTGKRFAWEHEGAEAEPDLVIVGKSLGSLYPVSLVAGSAGIVDILEKGEDGSTFSKNPIACATAAACLRVFRSERLAERSAKTGQYFLHSLGQIKSRHIKEVRGRGLAVAIELFPSVGDIYELRNRLAVEGQILCAPARRRALRFTPPLVISHDEIDFAIEQIAKVLESIE